VPPSDLLAGGLCAFGLGLALLVLAVVPARSRQSGVARSLAAIDERYGKHAVPAGSPGSDSGTAVPHWLRGLGMRLSPSGAAATLQRRLDLVGNPPRWNSDRILAAKALGLLVLATLGVIYGLHRPAAAVAYAILGGAVGFFVPDLLLYNAGVKRQARIQQDLPDALDMLTVCVEAGLGFDAALAQVALNTQGPLAAEFARALQEMQIGKSRTQALRAMAARTTVPELRAFTSALIQASELGIATAAVLREQAKEMRTRRRQRAEEKAQKVPVKILFPLVACLFPSLFIIIIGPGVITIAHSLFGR
jgi:tight adherence protein C